MTHRTLLAQPSPVNIVRFAPRGRILSAGCEDGRLALWGFDQHARELNQAEAGDAVRDVIYSPRLSLLVTVGTDHLRGWRIPDLGNSFEWHVGAIEAARFLGEGKTAMVATDGRLVEIDLTDGKRLRQSEALGGRVRQLSTDRAGALLALTDGGEFVRLDAETLVSMERLSLGGAPRAFTLSPDGAWCALADDEVRVVPMGGQGAAFTLAVQAPCRLVYSAEGRLLLAGGADGRIVMFDTARQRELRTMEGHQGAIGSLALMHGRGLLASAGADGTVRTWDLKQARR